MFCPKTYLLTKMLKTKRKNNYNNNLFVKTLLCSLLYFKSKTINIVQRFS